MQDQMKTGIEKKKRSKPKQLYQSGAACEKSGLNPIIFFHNFFKFSREAKTRLFCYKYYRVRANFFEGYGPIV